MFLNLKKKQKTLTFIAATFGFTFLTKQIMTELTFQNIIQSQQYGREM